VTEIAEVLRAWQAGAGLPVPEYVGVLESPEYARSRAQYAGDLYAHAPGRVCMKCDRLIVASQPARRRGESGWVHDVCPFTGQ